MIIKTGLTTQSSYENNAIEKPIGAILLVFKFAASMVVSLGATLQSVFNDATANLSLITKDGNDKRLWSSHKIHDLVEWATNQEGAVRYDHTGTRIEEVRALIPICPHGVLPMDNDESFRLKLDGLSIDPGLTIDIEGLEGHFRDYEVIKHHKLYLSSGTLEKQFNCEKMKQLVFPLDANLLDVQISYSNGVTVEHSLQMLKAIQSATNDLVWSDTNGDVKSGFERLCILDVSGAKSVDVRLSSGSYEFYAVSHVSGVLQENVISVNDKLVDTTVANRIAEQNQLRRSS